MSKILSLTENFSFMMRVRLRLYGRVFIGMKTRPGWRSSAPHYIVKCPAHGLVETYSQGWKELLICRECARERDY